MVTALITRHAITEAAVGFWHHGAIRSWNTFLSLRISTRKTSCFIWMTNEAFIAFGTVD